MADAQATRHGSNFQDLSGQRFGRMKCGRCLTQPKSPQHNDWMRRFIESMCDVSENGCWEWRGTRVRHGYGIVKLRRKNVFVHRLSYELFVGAIEKGMCVCHSCDNPRCCNPCHLWLGTQLDNIRDRDAKRRHATGDRHPKAKLTHILVSEIRAKAADGKGYRALSREYGVCHTVIRDAVVGNTWQEARS